MDKQKEIIILIGRAMDCCKQIQALLESVDARLLEGQKA